MPHSKNKLLIITGGSAGIGRATAELFKEKGYQILNLSRRPLPPHLGQHLQVDLSDPNWPNQATAQIDQTCAQRDQITLIHNAAILRKDRLQAASAELAKVFQVNLIAAQQLNEIVLPHMRRDSAILYIGSTLSEKAVPGALSYTASKHALLGLMRASCQDLMGSGIHTACLCPGFTDTQMLRDHLGGDPKIIEQIAAANSYHRLLTPKEIAQTLLFAAATPAINGSLIHANLGQRET
ncbi:MAG: SDR family oxidoreductase [Cellvibrionales bacterium]|nr:SDR family oxidoreductase [Cellvibrionales bacterium]